MTDNITCFSMQEENWDFQAALLLNEVPDIQMSEKEKTELFNQIVTNLKQAGIWEED